MEIQELIFFYLHESTKMIEVQFRLSIDSDEKFRTDMVDINETSDLGYELLVEDYDLYENIDEEEDDDFYWLDTPSIDEDNLISFLNEYYIIYPEKLPKTELI